MTLPANALSEGVIAEWVPIQGHNGETINGYSVRPTGPGPYPGVVLIMEVYGHVEHTREMARKFADHGYLTISPDLYHRERPGTAEEAAAVVRAAGGEPDDRCLGDLEGSIRYLRSLPSHNGKVGIIGHCSGGRQVYLAACNISGLDAAVVCYGGRVVATPEQLSERQPKAPVDMTADLGCPVLGLFGIEDQNPTPEMVARMEEELKRHGKTYEFHMYENAGHGFFADYRASYRQHAAVDGYERIFGWFGKYLTA